jgi:hypothetical protein
MTGYPEVDLHLRGSVIKFESSGWAALSRDRYDVEPADLKRATDRMDS